MKRDVADLMALVESGAITDNVDQTPELTDVSEETDDVNKSCDELAVQAVAMEQLLIAHEALTELMATADPLNKSSAGYRKIVALNFKHIANGVNRTVGTLPETAGFAMESISLEEDSAFETFLKYLWKTIVYIVKNIWEAVASLFTAVFGSTGRLRRAAKALQEKADRLGVVRVSKPVNYRKYPLRLAINNKVPTHVNDILIALTTVTDTLSTVNNSYQKLLVDTGNKMLDGLNRFNAYNANESLNYLNQCAEIYTMADPNFIFKTHRIDNGHDYMGPMLPGNRYIRLSLPRRGESSDNTSLVGIAHSNRSTKYLVETLASTNTQDHNGIAFNDMDTSFVSRIASNVVAICDLMESIEKKNIKPLIELKDKLSAATLRVEQDAYRRTDVNKELSEAIAAAMRYNSAFSSWGTQLQVGVVRNAMDTCRASIEICTAFIKAID